MKVNGKRRLILIVSLAVLGLAVAVLWLRRPPPPPIRIGVLHSFTGPMAVSSAPLADAVRLAVEEINAAGGLLGRPVELVVADGRSDLGVFAAEAERLIGQEKVSALFACATTACRKAVRPVVEKHNHLMFYPAQYEGLEQSPNIVYLGGAPNQQIIPGTRWALDTFGRRVYLVGSDYIFPRATHRIIRDLVTVAGGTVLAEHQLPLEGAEFGAIADEIRRLKPDVVLNSISGDGNRHFFLALRAAGLEKIPVLSFSMTEAELQAMGPEVFHPFHYAVSHYFQSLPDEANRRFVGSFQARFGAQRVTTAPIESAYNGVRLWASAVREAGTEAPEYTTRGIGRQSVSGPSGVIAVDAATRHLWKRVRIGHARPDGQFEEIQPASSLLRPAPFPAYRSRTEWLRIAAEIEAPEGREP